MGYEVKKDEMDYRHSTHGEMKDVQKFWFENLKGKNHSADLDEYGRTVSKRISGKYSGKELTGFIWLRRGTSDKLLMPLSSKWVIVLGRLVSLRTKPNSPVSVVSGLECVKLYLRFTARLHGAVRIHEDNFTVFIVS